ncbi:MAG TPA: GGDEF domain-containing protein [Gaiellaceae bacterium]|nr:GGDEF domain-containing protein [Gaiellaceae bacterium]
MAVTLAVPLAGFAWFVDDRLARQDVDRVDARLASALALAGSRLKTAVADADATAEKLASSRQVGRAMLRGDRVALSALVSPVPGAAVWVGGRRLAGPPVGRADLVRTVRVLSRGRLVGRVTVAVRLDGALVQRIAGSQESDGVSILLARGGRVLAGAPAGERLLLDPGRPARVRLDGSDRRALAVAVTGTKLALAAAVPQSLVDRATRRTSERIVLASAASLLALVVLADLLAPLAVRRTRRRRLGEELARLDLLGHVLEARHDREALFPVVLQTMVDAAGASGGLLLEGVAEVARTGDVGTPGEPLLIPLHQEGTEMLFILSAPPGGFDGERRRRARHLAPRAAAALEHARLDAVARAEAATDPLTGLANRRRFMAELESELARAARYERPLALILIDLDDFEAVNDRFGHAAGDGALRRLGELLRAGTREADVPARLGGEEFAVLLPESDLEGAIDVAERLRRRFGDVEVDVPDGSGPLALTASLGVAAAPPYVASGELLDLAGRALYEAKALGTNRIERAQANTGARR